jgi:hypothetical protein
MDNPFDSENFPTDEHPECLVMGQFVGWKLLYDYDGADFSLMYNITQVGTDENVQINGTQTVLSDDEYWVFEVPTATSAAWNFTVDGECRWDLVLTKTATNDKVILETGFLNLFLTASDRKTHAEIMLTKINSIIEGRADADVSSYSIKSRSITKMSIQELTEWRNYYVNEVKRTGGSTKTFKGTPKDNTVRVRFT